MTREIQISLNAELMNLLRALLTPADQRAVSARLVVPRHRSLSTRSSVQMPTNILADFATLVPIEFDNIGGSPVATPTGDTATVTNDNEAACVATTELDAGVLNLVLSPVQPAQLGAVCNVSVSNLLPDGKTVVTPTVDFVLTADGAVANAHLNTSAMTTRALPPPAAPAAAAPTA
jgi:hypothetical protein